VETGGVGTASPLRAALDLDDRRGKPDETDLLGDRKTGKDPVRPETPRI